MSEKLAQMGDKWSAETPDGAADVAGLYQAYAHDLHRYVTRQFGAGPPEPDDVVQAAFARLAAMAEPDKVENPRAYLYAAVRNIVIDYHRSAGRQQAQAAAYSNPDGENLSEITPESVLEQRERFEILSRALQRLPAKRRRMILLNRYEGLTCDEIGQRFGMSGPAVQKQIERGLAECLRYLEAMEREDYRGS